MSSTIALDLRAIAHALLPEGVRRLLARLLEQFGELTGAAAALIALLVRVLR